MNNNESTKNLKIELKTIKYSPSLSQETTAFTASLYVDGKKVAECMNSGHGGCTTIHALTDQREVLNAATAQALAEIKAGKYDQSQSEMEKMFGAGDWTKYLLSVTARDGKVAGSQAIETVVDHLLDEHLKAKENQKIVNKERKIAEKWSKGGIKQMIRVEEHGSIAWIPVQTSRGDSCDGVLGETHKKHPNARVTVLSTWEAMGQH